ncbi:thioesterase family protein, partial [Acinetobacter baumannii]
DFHVVKSVVEYKSPIRFDAEIEVGARIARIGTSSMTFELAIFLKDSGNLMATGEVVWVNTDQSTHRPAPIAAEIRNLIASREKHLA